MQSSIQLHYLNAHIKLHVKVVGWPIGSLSFSLCISSKKEKKEKKVKDVHAFSFVESLCFVAIFSKLPL
jgi:hypothetical protein